MPNQKKEIERQIETLNTLAADIHNAKKETNRIIDPDRITPLDDAMSSVQEAIRELQERLRKLEG